MHSVTAWPRVASAAPPMHSVTVMYGGMGAHMRDERRSQDDVAL
jgi:hypothetical protein